MPVSNSKRMAFVTALAVLTPLAVFGATVNSSWETLAGTAEIGRTVVITRMNTTSLRGKLVSVGDQSIIIQQRNGSQAIPRGEVFQVRYARRKHPVLLGTLIGAGTGTLICLAAGGSSRSSSKTKANADPDIGLFLGAGAGALVGGLLPDGPILFQAPGRPKPPRAR